MTPAPSSPAEGDASEEKAEAKATAPKKVARIEPKDREATVLNRSVPSYPPDAYRAREEGTVVVKAQIDARSEEHTSELQSLMRISYAVFCLKKNNTTHLDLR